MTRRSWIVVAALLALGALVLALWIPDRIAEARAPRPVAAWVAIEEAGSPVARVGRVELTAGTPFRLHAVLEALDHRGETVYFTEARELELGGRPVPEESLRRWPEGRHVRILWFTVEGIAPFLPVAESGDLERFELQELLRPDWPRAWSIPGTLEPRRDEHLRRGLEQRRPEIGTQRFHVRIELLDAEDAMVPSERIRSWGVADLPERLEGFPTVVAALPEPLHEVSRVFGLTQIEVTASPAPAALVEEIAELERQELVFRRSTLLERHLEGSGRRLEDLAWRELVIGGSGAPLWQQEARPGDLVRLGERFVVLYRPAGDSGLLDGDDLVFDFERGALRGPLEVFFAPSLLEWAPLTPRTP
jgi:hypothetical protein